MTPRDYALVLSEAIDLPRSERAKLLAHLRRVALENPALPRAVLRKYAATKAAELRAPAGAEGVRRA